MTTYAYNQLVQAFKKARVDIEANATSPSQQHLGANRVALALADVIKDEDPKFDTARFMRDTGAVADL